MKKLVVIGANNFQLPLVLKAREMGIETHVFAWEEGAVAKDFATKFYPVSITEKEQILEQAQKIKPHGIISIGSDLAMIAVNYVADKLGLVGNTMHCTQLTTNKYRMRQQLQIMGCPCPRYMKVDDTGQVLASDFGFPLIVKPTDRSGSRGVTKVESPDCLTEAIERAKEESFCKEVLVESFIIGKEYSIESISWRGQHFVLQITEKETSGAPYFVEKAQHQPANIPESVREKVVAEVVRSLDTLKVQNGASHSEIFITPDNQVFIAEIGARMGGDFIGSDLVQLSTGFDYVKAVIEIALGTFDPKSIRLSEQAFSGVYFIFPTPGKVVDIVDNSKNFPEIVRCEIYCEKGDEIQIIRESGKRPAAYIYSSDIQRFSTTKTVVEIVTQ
jgi:biotin carboxylase